MESRRLRPLLVIVMLLSASYLSYSVGRESGERESRAVLERQMKEMRMALAANAVEDDILYHGDTEFEDANGDEYYEQEYDDVADETISSTELSGIHE